MRLVIADIKFTIDVLEFTWTEIALLAAGAALTALLAAAFFVLWRRAGRER